uniref:Acyl-CoA_dh_N domain-containing protein n=1 Tax=Meloidogyne incognita TaxID=6306 RepID=A0A914MG54_MELIC
MFRLNFALQTIPKIFNISVRRASVNRGLNEKSEKNEIDQITEMVPIEKRSLSRGAMLNKFEKDFMIFPEYLELAEIVNIKSYVGKLGDDLDKTIPHIKTSPGLMPSEIVDVLMKNGIFGAIIPKDFGGVGFQQKDVLQLVECISSRDLSIFSNLVLNDSSHRGEEIGIKIDKGQYIFQQVMSLRRYGRAAVLGCTLHE